jgi:hypothetical protein
MATCAYQSAAATWKGTQVSPDQCNEDWVVVPVGDYVQYKQLQAQVLTSNSWFAVPPATDFAAAWQAGFLIPMVIGMIAWAAAKVASVFTEEH